MLGGGILPLAVRFWAITEAERQSQLNSSTTSVIWGSSASDLDEPSPCPAEFGYVDGNDDRVWKDEVKGRVRGKWIEGSLYEESREAWGQAGFTQSTSKVPRTEILCMGLTVLTKAESTKTGGLRLDWWLFSLYSELRGCPCSDENDSREGGELLPQGP